MADPRQWIIQQTEAKQIEAMQIRVKETNVKSILIICGIEEDITADLLKGLFFNSLTSHRSSDLLK